VRRARISRACGPRSSSPAGLDSCPRALRRRVPGSRPRSRARAAPLSHTPRPRRPFRPPGSGAVWGSITPPTPFPATSLAEPARTDAAAGSSLRGTQPSGHRASASLQRPGTRRRARAAPPSTAPSPPSTRSGTSALASSPGGSGGSAGAGARPSPLPTNACPRPGVGPDLGCQAIGGEDGMESNRSGKSGRRPPASRLGICAAEGHAATKAPPRAPPLGGSGFVLTSELPRSFARGLR
jgi:hypothetical protein